MSTLHYLDTMNSLGNVMACTLWSIPQEVIHHPSMVKVKPPKILCKILQDASSWISSIGNNCGVYLNNVMSGFWYELIMGYMDISHILSGIVQHLTINKWKSVRFDFI